VLNLVTHTDGGKYAEVVGNRLLRRIFAPKRDKAARERIKLHNEELNDLYFSHNFRFITRRRMR
jgi:hypothetical protein